MRQAAEHEILHKPPQGKALVNFHRPARANRFIDYLIFDRTKFVGNTEGRARVQYVCDPGEHIFQGRKELVSVIKADLLADKVYDVFVQPRMGVWGMRIIMEPVRKDDPRRLEIPEWEDKETTWILVPDGVSRGLELELLDHNEKILRNFIEGPKGDRVLHLFPQDHR